MLSGKKNNHVKNKGILRSFHMLMYHWTWNITLIWKGNAQKEKRRLLRSKACKCHRWWQRILTLSPLWWSIENLIFAAVSSALIIHCPKYHMLEQWTLVRHHHNIVHNINLHSCFSNKLRANPVVISTHFQILIL